MADQLHEPGEGVLVEDKLQPIDLIQLLSNIAEVQAWSNLETTDNAVLKYHFRILEAELNHPEVFLEHAQPIPGALPQPNQ